MTTPEKIRRIFLQPQARYTISEAAALLEYSHEQITALIDSGDLSVEASETIARLPWEEVAFAAAERWPQELIETALGPDLDAVMPELARLTEIRLRVPQFSVLTLQRVAQREGTTLGHIAARQFIDLAAAEADTLERSVTGLTAALRWPLR